MLYIVDVSDIIKSYDLEAHFYSDDGHVYSSCAPHDADRLYRDPDDRLHLEHQGTDGIKSSYVEPPQRQRSCG